MIDVKIFQTPSGEYTGFQMSGHAGYAEYGQDIVCAAVSALVINAINSVDPDTGSVFFQITDRPVSTSSQLLLKSLVLGLNGIEDEYGKKHIKIRLEKQEG